MNGPALRALFFVAVALYAFALAAPRARAQEAISGAEDCTKESDPDRAIAACDRAITSGNFDDRARAILLYNRGLAYQARRDFDLAIKDYDEAIRLRPDLTAAYYNRGVSHFRRNEDDLAIIDLDHAISLDPQNGDAYRGRGDAYQSKGDNDRAITDYSEALRLNPKDAEAFSDRGISYMDKMEYPKAIEDFNHALSIDPKFAIVLTNRGTAYSNLGDDVHAIADFNHALELNPNLALAYNNRGISHNNRNEFGLAVADFNQAMRLNPAFAEPYYNRGRVRFERGGFSAAASDFAAAVAREPSELYFSIWLYLDRARAGQEPEAVLSDAVKGGDPPDPSVWPGPVIRMLGGMLSPQELLAAAANPDALTQRNQICEAHFYIAESDMLSGDRGKARAEFQAAISACPHSFDEYISARAELRGLSSPPRASASAPARQSAAPPASH